MIALVQNAQHDVDRKDRQQDQHWLGGERSLKRLCGALEPAMNIRGHADLLARIFDGRRGLRKRNAGGEIERQGCGRGERLVVHSQGHAAGNQMRYRGKRDLCSIV